MSERVLVLGGARSGKSRHAEALLADQPNVTYVAPASWPDDADWQARIAGHRARRPSGWHTVESADVAGLLRTTSGALLVDCVATWLDLAMAAAGCWTSAAGAGERLASSVDQLVLAWTTREATVVMVSNEVGQGVVPATESGRLFRDEMGRLNARLAASADTVWFLVAGLPTRLK